MEESSERVVRLEQHDEITTGDDLVIHSIPQDLALAVSAIYDRMMVDVEELLFNQIRDTFLSYTTPSYLGFVGLPDEECQRPRPALCKARRRRDPPPRVSRRSSQVSPPIYLRHRGDRPKTWSSQDPLRIKRRKEHRFSYPIGYRVFQSRNMRERDACELRGDHSDITYDSDDFFRLRFAGYSLDER
ncbi:hypothetical protein F2Q68_00029086 [Brassica cretica]|uniref:Uncharacterized protein n=2 Tax=Brassica cretica TaxID=69181 RepID=A0ABQ7BM36_BRACR|nr:hypothetical protein F2Q68_00029086 [Brassica cretica]KAF3532981.1 hypothetical protein DY000_02036850 [Brassica cretica]